jgi:hypothetical protein
MASGPKGVKAVAKSKKAGELASSGKSRKAADDAKSPFSGHEKLTPKEIESVGSYQGHVFNPVNDFLRGKTTSILSDYGEHIPRLDKIISKTKFTQDVTLYRGTSPIPGVNFAELQPGHTISDLGFHSTSTSASVAEKFIGISDYGNPSAFITIKASKGQKGLAVHKVDTGSQYGEGPKNEHEVLLPRGSTFKVLKVGLRKDGNLHITVRLQ